MAKESTAGLSAKHMFVLTAVLKRSVFLVLLYKIWQLYICKDIIYVEGDKSTNYIDCCGL
jgi:hypothetical protein